MTPDIKIHAFHRQEAAFACPPDSLSAKTEDARPSLGIVYWGGHMRSGSGIILDGKSKSPWFQIFFVLRHFWFDQLLNLSA